MLINNDYAAFVGGTKLVENNNSLGSSQGATNGNEVSSFGDLLNKELNNSDEALKFSKHALNRMSQRNISLEPELINKVENAVTSAQEKGITDALILGSNNAFIVNVPTRTVITTMNSNDMKENIITNIDGTVIL